MITAISRATVGSSQYQRPYRSLATSYLFSAAFERTETPPVAPRKT